MKTVIVALFLLVLARATEASEVFVGGVELAIPAPQGFSAVAPEEGPLFEVEPQNELLVAFVPTTRIGDTPPDEDPDLERYFTVQADRNLTPIAMSGADFLDLRQFVLSQNEELVEEVQQQVPGEIARLLDEESASEADLDALLSAGQMIPFAAHDTANRTLAYSYVVGRQIVGDSRRSSPRLDAVTVSLTHVRGKVLLLYAHAHARDLEWTRSASRQWVEAVLSANAADTPVSASDDPVSNLSDRGLQARPLTSKERSLESIERRGIDWRCFALYGACGVIFAGLMVWMFRRSKSS